VPAVNLYRASVFCYCAPFLRYLCALPQITNLRDYIRFDRRQALLLNPPAEGVVGIPPAFASLGANLDQMVEVVPLIAPGLRAESILDDRLADDASPLIIVVGRVADSLPTGGIADLPSE
jgi:hypothetical protein